MARTLLLGLLLLVRPLTAGAQERARVSADSSEIVVLVHGMGRSAWSMRSMQRRLEREGYTVLNWGYSSTCCRIAELAARLADTVRALPPRRIHFVTHSLGGLLVRWVLVHERPDSLGRIVMMAPPNQGSRMADRMAGLLRRVYPPIAELGTGANGAARRIPMPPGLDVGIIVGAHDGKVSLDEARLPGYPEPVVVPAAHSFLMRRDDVQRLTVQFLRTGRFR